MSTPNERRTKAGYDLFLAADPDNPDHWDPESSPLAAVMDENIEWFDDEGHPGGLAAPTYREIGSGSEPADGEPADGVLGRLRALRREMFSCQILSCSEATDDEVLAPGHGLVHTFDHAVKRDETAYGRTRPHLCASSFTFNEKGKVTTVRYCSAELPPLHLPFAPGETAS